jgi:selenocysteine lyase/cysteine desulfurase
VAQGLDWREGDEVITYTREYPTLVLPWLQLRDLGVQVRFVEDRSCRYEIDDVKELITQRTRVVVLSLVNFAHGFRAPLEEIGRLCKERDIWFVVDACQALGAVPVDVGELGADIVSAHAYKHLLGGFGVSICYCSARARTELRVTGAGATGRDRETIIGSIGFEEPLSRDARRFESSFQTSGAIAGFLESLRLLVDGPEGLYHGRIAHLAGLLADGVREQGWVVGSSLREGERSSIISITRPETDLARVQSELVKRRVVFAHRAGFLRIAPHFYNTTDEVEALLAELSSQ